MKVTHSLSASLLVACGIGLPAAPGSAREGLDLRVRGRLQSRWESVQWRDEREDAFVLRRARIDGRWRSNESLELVLEIEGTHGVALKDAYAEYEIHELLVVTAGHFKKPFSRRRMTSPWRLFVPERGMIDEHFVSDGTFGGYGGRGVGLMASGKLSGFAYHVGAFGGSPTDGERVQTTRDIVARLSFEPMKSISVAVGASHKRNDRFATALRATLYDAGLRLSLSDAWIEVEGMYGDNVDAGDGRRMLGGHATGGYAIAVGPTLTLTPAAMVEALDPDDRVDNGAALRVAGALNLDVGEAIRWVVAYEHVFWRARAYDPVEVRPRALETPNRFVLQLNLSL